MSDKNSRGVVVGTVAALSRFPVKSMRGERLHALDLRWPGMHGDRQYGFHRAEDRSRFPWLTARELSNLVLFRPSFRDPSDPRHSPVDVELPSGEQMPLDAPALTAMLSAEVAAEVRLMQAGRGLFDAMPVSLATTASLAEIDAVHGAPLDARRFRLNIIVDSGMRDAEWRSGLLAFGEDDDGPKLLVNDGIPRCSMVTIDPDTAERDASVMRTGAQRFGNKVGVYCSAAAIGTIRSGDRVRFIPV